MARLSALESPFEPEVKAQLEAMMPAGSPPIGLFRTMVRNRAMTTAMHGFGAYELSRELSVRLREREVVILRTCAGCGAEYEWGVHVEVFAQRAVVLNQPGHGTDPWADGRIGVDQPRATPHSHGRRALGES